MLPNIIKITCAVFLIFVFGSCGISKRTDAETQIKLPKVKEETLVKKLSEISKIKPAFYYSRANTKFKDNSQNLSFTTSVRMKTDSATQATMTFARIPVLTAMITQDSVSVLNTRNKCYVQESIDFFREVFGFDFNYKNVEELILGLPIAWNEEEKYHQIKDAYNYIISPLTKHEIKRLKIEENEDLILYYLSDDLQALNQTVIERPDEDLSIIIQYKNRELFGDYNIPTEIEVNVNTPSNNIFINFRTTKVVVNEPEELFFSIPDKYERCE